MSIKRLQQRFAQVGVIRLGEQRISKNNKPYPAKLETFRFTSPSRALIDAVATMYGGEVRPWQSNTGGQWEVISKVKEIPVLVPPQVVDPNYELWGNGFRDRFCDGETEQIRNSPCLCAAQFGQDFSTTAPPGKACKPTTRMSLMLADLVSLGTFKLESHGWNAAAELPMLASAIAAAPGPLPARLEIQARQKKILRPDAPKDKQIETRDYLVPVLHFDFVTPAQAFSGHIGTAAQAALGGATDERAAIGTAPEPSAELPRTAEQFMVLARLARDPETIRTLWAQAVKADVLDQALSDFLKTRAADLGAEPKSNGNGKPAAAEAVKPTSAPPAEVVEGEPEPDGQALWFQVLAIAGADPFKWSNSELEKRIRDRFEQSFDEIDGWQMRTFLGELKNRQVV